MHQNDELKIFCQNVKLLRERAGLSKRSMAAILGIGTASLTKIEGGTIPKRVSTEIIFTLSDHFKLKITDLFFPLP